MPPPAPPVYPAPATGGYPAPQVSFSPPGTLVTPSGVPYATWGTRVGGYLIDLVIFIPVLVVLYILFRHTNTLEVHLMMRRGHGHKRTNISLLPPIISGVLFLVYATLLCGGQRGQTVGMRAVGVRVVRNGSEGVLGYGLAFGRALVEQVFRLLSFTIIFLVVVWLLDMLWPLWDKPRRQTLHDKVVHTVVLQAPRAR
jgi:uncharacterized RDD family membrane protein YckC